MGGGSEVKKISESKDRRCGEWGLEGAGSWGGGIWPQGWGHGPPQGREVSVLFLMFYSSVQLSSAITALRKITKAMHCIFFLYFKLFSGVFDPDF